MSRAKAPRKGQKGPTIDDVARRAGVSHMTVSRVLNQDGGVRPATRERVNAAIAKLGFVRNAAARSLAGAPQCRVALIYSNPSAHYLGELLLGSLAQARESDVELLVEPYDGQALVERLVGHRIDGVVLPPPLSDDQALLTALNAVGLETVRLATGWTDKYSHSIAIDDESAARAMTIYLLGLGHRRIGFILGDANQTASGLRRQGYEHALRDAGIVPDPCLVVAGDFSFYSGLAATEALLALPQPPTAIFASNDDMAAAAINVAHRLAFSVPRDLTICGFDDTAIARTLWPELTTIRQPVAAMARAAMRLLVESIRGLRSGSEVERQHLLLDFELVERRSTAAPKMDA
ncbi:MAG TPA: LacI family DNA-binding transcriptional regulator [Sphingobium sp.]|uniref:LacI family DNA-binding transcriptional regulator n=1 Tax=Sphingobium sp. TaxID=1912891 RepID=UPI002ED62C5D